MWISVKGFGIHIFDSTESRSLYNGTISNRLNTIALTKNFDLYAADFLNNRVLIKVIDLVSNNVYHKFIYLIERKVKYFDAFLEK